MNKRKIFNDPVHGFITIPHELIFDIIQHPWFQRLRRIRQLGLSELVYPGAIHTRFHHALGAFHLMRKAIAVLRIKGHKVSAKEELAASIAVLLHDIGHGPYSHALEHHLVRHSTHEQISLLYFRELNKQFKGKLDLALKIFEGQYHKRFLHQLVSSQLDVDRLDYLTRDSFFTGVSEGIISYDRIIEMMNVVNDELVIEEKGKYSIESFIVSRRLMYWQVYLHKTVLCAEQMLVKTIERARFTMNGRHPKGDPTVLGIFLQNSISLNDMKRDSRLLNLYSQLDDSDILAALKSWQWSSDPVLGYLSRALVNRLLFKIEMSDEAVPPKKLQQLRKQVAKALNIQADEAAELVLAGSTTNHAYDALNDRILIHRSNGKTLDIADASDQLNIKQLSVPVVKHFVCYPKNIEP